MINQSAGIVRDSPRMYTRYYRSQIRRLPPVDAFSRMDLSKLSEYIMEWPDFDKEQYDIYLAVRPKDLHDPDDKVGRVEAWMRQRLDMPKGWNWIIYN